MAPISQRFSIRVTWAMIGLAMLIAGRALAQYPQPLPFEMRPSLDRSHDVSDLYRQIEHLNREIEALKAFQYPVGSPVAPASNLVAEPCCCAAETLGDSDSLVAYERPGGSETWGDSSFFVTYDNRWVIRPRDKELTPFELGVNFYNQFLYTYIDTEKDRFVDNAGVVRPVNDRNSFDINRGFMVFSGYAIDPNLRYFTLLDYNTLDRPRVQLIIGWCGYEFSEKLTLHAGQGQVPGTWEWLVSARYVLGIERTMATTFFRPSLTAGIWATGKLSDAFHYRVMVGDGFNSFGVTPTDRDTKLAYSAMFWWEPLGSYGRGHADFANRNTPVVRLGHAFTYAGKEGDRFTGLPGPEQSIIRLSDGTVLVSPGALAPGVQVNKFDVSLYTVHFGAKYRGLSFSSEYFFRWLTSIKGTGPLPVSSLFDHGFMVNAGAFLVPHRVGVYALGSHVTGEFGSGSEVGGGLNYYIKERENSKFTVEFVYIESSPAQQARTGLVAGLTGPMLRAQYHLSF